MFLTLPIVLVIKALPCSVETGMNQIMLHFETNFFCPSLLQDGKISIEFFVVPTSTSNQKQLLRVCINLIEQSLFFGIKISPVPV